MREYQPLHSISYTRGVNFSRARLAPELNGYLAEGSWNTLFLGAGYHKPFRGLASQGANTGSRLMRAIGKTWGGSRDIGVTRGSGSVIEDIRRSLWGIGSGQVHIEGTDIAGFTLSTLLKVSLLSGGVYQTPVTAGLSQPSAPSIGIATAQGDPSGAVSCKIEKRRPSTGGRSRASNTSAVINPQGKKVRVTFPAIGDGTHWRVFFTLQRFGGEGIHYALAYNNSLDIPEAVVAAGNAEGIARSLLFDWKDGDLVAEEASYDDYSPEAGTHLMRLGNVMNVLGSFPDAVSSPTTTNTGTAIQVSKTNNYESYVPTHLLFLPEQVVDVQSRSIDDYGLIACENSVHALSYVGPRGDELPACTITTLLPDIGVKYPHNWTHFRGQIAIYTAEGNLIVMDSNGEINTEIAAPMRRFIKNWLPQETIVGYCPKNDCLILANGKIILIYSLETGEWTAAWLPDYGITANVLACQSAKRRLYISCTDNKAYEFDAGAVDPVPVSFVSHFTNAPNPAAIKNLYQMSLSVETNYLSSPVVICLSRNLRAMAFRDISTNGLSPITSAGARFSASHNGLRFALFGKNIGGAGVDYLTGFVTYVSASQLVLTNNLGAPINLPVRSDLLMFVGDYVQTESVTNQESEHLPDFFPDVVDARSFAAAVWFQTNDETGSVLDLNLFGTMKPTTRL